MTYTHEQLEDAVIAALKRGFKDGYHAGFNDAKKQATDLFMNFEKELNFHEDSQTKLRDTYANIR